jgi:hypothetical protein
MSLWMLFLLFALIKIPLLGMMLWMPFRNDENDGVSQTADSSEQDGGSKTMPADPRDPHRRGPWSGPRPRRGPSGCAPLPSLQRSRCPSAPHLAVRACETQRLRLR